MYNFNQNFLNTLQKEGYACIKCTWNRKEPYDENIRVERCLALFPLLAIRASPSHASLPLISGIRKFYMVIVSFSLSLSFSLSFALSFSLLLSLTLSRSYWFLLVLSDSYSFLIFFSFSLDLTLTLSCSHSGSLLLSFSLLLFLIFTLSCSLCSLSLFLNFTRSHSLSIIFSSIRYLEHSYLHYACNNCFW
jgi:hypothetical protein